MSYFEDGIEFAKPEKTTQTYKVFSIDAWGNAEGGYDWNQWFDVGTIDCDINNQESVIQAMIDGGFVKPSTIEGFRSVGDVEDDGYSLVLVNKETREPIFAVVYGDKF